LSGDNPRDTSSPDFSPVSRRRKLPDQSYADRDTPLRAVGHPLMNGVQGHGRQPTVRLVRQVADSSLSKAQKAEARRHIWQNAAHHYPNS
jgi:hypothetical protein